MSSNDDTIFLFIVQKNEPKDLKKNLKKVLGFTPKNISLYETAFIHKSASFVNKDNQVINNERLEFLGDAILDAVISDFLFKNFPAENEGFLTKTRAKIVNTKMLAKVASEFNLKRFLQMQTDNEFNNENLCADTFEALIGAIYMDKGYKLVREFINKKVIGNVVDVEKLISTESNHKSNLIEWAQKKGYVVRFATFEHKEDQKMFVAKIMVNDNEVAEGYGKTKKEAEQMSALKAIKKINPEYNNEQKND
ncbi:MAG: ribonuclease III [Bacteroidales bacterium]|nr:ribonuclease III [Bacteroidales bacterium]